MADAVAPWELVRTETFLRALRKYLGKHPDRAVLVRRVLVSLTAIPRNPALRLHALTGRLQGLHAVRVTHSDRIVLILAIRKHQIVLLDIGTHDAVYV